MSILDDWKLDNFLDEDPKIISVFEIDVFENITLYINNEVLGYKSPSRC